MKWEIKEFRFKFRVKLSVRSEKMSRKSIVTDEWRMMSKLLKVFLTFCLMALLHK